jgi:hypothetical protein
MNPTMRGTLRLCLMAFVAALWQGCGSTRVVFVNPTDHDLVRLGPDVRGHVYFWTGSSWELSANVVRLPEGWYAGYVSPAGEDGLESSETDIGSAEPASVD